jgi:GH15 family glucan-1,4-alpha-glucosidase
LPHASYDLWEEKFATHMYTVAVVYQALLVAAELAERFEYPDDAVRWRDVAATVQKGSTVFFDKERGAFRKSFLLQDNGSLEFDNTLDVSSFYGAVMFGLCDINDDEIKRTAGVIESVLLDKTPSGGSPRYEHDHYFESDSSRLGNPWFVATLWMAQYYARIGQPDKTRHYLQWTFERTLPSGMLSEQVNPNNSQPISVAPLVWSHAEFVNTVLDLSKLK